MRPVPADMATKLGYSKQTHANSANISPEIYIRRPETPLNAQKFLEREMINTSGNVTDIAIATSCPRLASQNISISLCYVDNGVGRFKIAAPKLHMSTYNWVDYGFRQNADNIAVAYDGDFEEDDSGDMVFVSDTLPWIFWIKDGVLKGQLQGTDTIITLESSGCTAVSAIRAYWDVETQNDYGLMVFYVSSNLVYYRQLIGGVWYDRRAVTLQGLTLPWVDVATFRTRDYRIGVQLKNTSNNAYELFCTPVYTPS